MKDKTDRAPSGLGENGDGNSGRVDCRRLRLDSWRIEIAEVVHQGNGDEELQILRRGATSWSFPQGWGFFISLRR